MFLLRISLAAVLLPLGAADRTVDPTFLRRHVPAIAAKPMDAAAPGCRYRPVFGEGDPDARHLKSVSRFGELLLDANAKCPPVRREGEEQIYLLLEGAGAVEAGGARTPLRQRDFVYLAPGVPHSLECGAAPCRAVLMGFRVPRGVAAAVPPKLPVANMDAAAKQVVGNHPPSTLYQLLLGGRDSKRDLIAAGHTVTSLFTMEFAPGGTNFPHHHDREEEIYLVLEGHGDMVAGGGMDGVEGRHPAKAGDAYFFRLNCTVGFYGHNKPGEPKSLILAVRSLYPFAR